MLDSFATGVRMPNPAFQFTLPQFWPSKVRSEMLHVVSLVQYAVISTRSWTADSSNARVRLQAERDRFQQEAALLRDEIRIKDARMKSLSPSRRPYYPPTERLDILEFRAARGWSLPQTAETFLVCPKTVASGMKRIHEEGLDAIAQLRVPVNKFPDFVRYAIQRHRPCAPRWAKRNGPKSWHGPVSTSELRPSAESARKTRHPSRALRQRTQRNTARSRPVIPITSGMST